MKNSLYLATLILFFGLTPLFVYADELTVSSTTDSTVEATTTADVADEVSTTTSQSSTTPKMVDVPSDCTVTDTDGVEHVFPQSDSPSEYLGVCMLEAAREDGLIDFTLTNDPSFGLYIQSMDNVEPGATEYWAIWDNGEMAACGIGCIPLAQGDILSFVLTDWMTNAESMTIILTANSLIEPPIQQSSSTPPATPTPPSGGGGSGGGVSRTQLNISNALSYLITQQRADGSFGEPFLSDWAALALAAADSGGAKAKLREYMLTTTPSLSSITDYERHAMALEALNINPYSGTSVDYLTPIVNAFDGTQIGNASLDNDDIFAIFPLLSAGYTTSDAIIAKTVAFLLSRQGQNGSWDESIDITAAAIQALTAVRDLSGVSSALTRAEGYVRSTQHTDGGFGNSFSTSWVLQAISALGELPNAWMSGGHSPQEYLAGLQQSDGGIDSVSANAQMRLWATSYAIPAALGRTWLELLHSFAKPETRAAVNSGSALLLATSTPAFVATSTSAGIATSTLAVATSTPVMSIGVADTPATRALMRIKRSTIEPRTIAALEFVVPTLIDRQTAAATNAPIGNFFSHLWGSIAAFFRKVL